MPRLPYTTNAYQFANEHYQLEWWHKGPLIGGLYIARSQTAACQQVDSIQVTVMDCPGKIPNVFTPNHDGLNDEFFIEGISLTPWQLKIYNRWGSCVYKSDAYQNDWQGEGLVTGTYYYQLSSSLLQKQYKGWVTIMR